MASTLDVMQFDFTVDDIQWSDGRNLYTLWLDKKSHSGFLPSFESFSEIELAPFKSHMIIVDIYRDPLRFKTRSTGSACDEIFGRNLAGRWVDELPDVQRGVHRFERALVEEKPYISTTPLYWAGKEHRSFHALQLPLSNEGSRIDTLIFLNEFL